MQLIQEAAIGRLVLVTSEQLLGELEGVLSRAKFAARLQRRGTTVERIVSNYRRSASLVGVRSGRFVPTDPKDDAVIGTAIEGEVDAVISGDHHLLELPPVHPFKVMQVSEAIELLGHDRDRGR